MGEHLAVALGQALKLPPAPSRPIQASDTHAASRRRSGTAALRDGCGESRKAKCLSEIVSVHKIVYGQLPCGPADPCGRWAA